MRLHLLLCLALVCPTLVAQETDDPFVAKDAAFVKSATKILLKFARTARSKKHGPMERSAYELIIADYDPNHSASRRALDYVKDRSTGDWDLKPEGKRHEWLDRANRKGRYELDKEWRATCEKLGNAHRELGLEMMAAQGARIADGARHLRLATLYNPFDKVAHEALGHEPWHNSGLDYYGNAEQVAFMKRMRELETFALMLAKKDYDPQPVDEIPDVLAKTGLTFYGAKTKNFTIFTRGTQENALDVVQWGERALDFLEFAVKGDKKVMQMARNSMKGWGYIAYLWTTPEMDTWKARNPELVPEVRGQYLNINYRGAGGKTCQVAIRNMPSHMHDHLIAHTWHYGLRGGGVNAGLIEGVHHAATWFLKSTCVSRFGAEPEGTETGRKRALPDGANWWLREMRNQALAHTDVPLNVVPRTELYKFSPDVRLKTWNFAVFSMARFPDGWLEFVMKMPHDKIPFPNEVEAIGEKAFGIPFAQVEQEWRDWASGRSVTAAATGYGPPLLPEFPNDDEIDGLERLNAVRRAVSTWAEPAILVDEEEGTNTLKEGWQHSMPACELDSEATAACKDHAKFFGMHEEHWRWPEAHEEDPAKEGFSPRGMRAGLRSVIVWSQGSLNATSAVDQWIGTVWHRFPLLEYNIKRFGIAYDEAGKCEVIVLDMGSLQEPRDRVLERQCAYIAWPPDEMRNVPRQFAYTEHPNPLEDVGLDFDAQQETGYPVSLQFTRVISLLTTDVSMKLYVAKKRGQKFEPDEEVPCWLHTPDEPLYKRMVLRNVVFVIPKSLLEPNTTYLAVVDLTFNSNKRELKWTFTTGAQRQGLGRMK